ncbi:MAG: GDP-mannose 4,6-dehydratase [candidate division KSB1 bacterium]|nr:GDP-mannose 4,6-dehydratase [candidate division KSB1 bacterium]MDZ7391481.1 GDP-mannose 4,6-dehydratase [candidate division KSB1 bacterium]MDZ7414224.1 GDP-mannose 4,6-dehydratase [candidate division KSB1 bacterium]
MRILVTGGAGFIGSHVVDAYIAEGHQVTVVDNLSTGRRENVHPKARFYEMDIRDAALNTVFAEGGFDVVNHHAAQMDVRRSVEDPIYDAQVNVLGTINLLQNCKRYGVRTFLLASTGGAVYGEQNVFPADEEHPTWPACPYGITKLACEKYVHFYGTTYGMRYFILRYANVYGPRQNPFGEAGVVAIFTTRLLTGKEAFIHGDGKQTRDYVYVDDVVRANVLALGAASSDYVNIGTGIETDVNTIFAKLNGLCGAHQKEVHDAPKEGEQRRSVLNIAKAKEVLGWEPEVSLDEGLRRTVAWFRAQLQTAQV